MLGERARAGFEVTQKLGVRRQHDRRSGIRQGLPVCLQGTVQPVELRILAERAGENLVGLGIGRATGDLGLALRFGQDYGALAIGFCLDFLSPLETLRP